MGNLIANIQDRVKTSSNALSLGVFKFFSASVVGLTFALIGQEIFQYGWFSFTLVFLTVTLSLMRIMRPWTWFNVLVFDLICVLIGLLLRMYILIAPG
jgi:hypothetical protein